MTKRGLGIGKEEVVIGKEEVVIKTKKPVAKKPSTQSLVALIEDRHRELMSHIKGLQDQLVELRQRLPSQPKFQESDGTIVELTDLEKDLVLKGNTIMAIKTIRDRCQIGIKDAKDSVDKWRKSTVWPTASK